jgi:hypothetical protein
VIRADGKQVIYYEDREGNYFSEQRKKEGWRWYVYYATMDNSYGKELLRSADVMVDELGLKGIFWDGFGANYGDGGEYTYDRWDGHTAEIDPKTKTLTRKVGFVLLLSQDVMVAFCHKMRDKDAQVIANNYVITRTIGKETYIIFDWEVSEGPWTHLAPTPAALSNPSLLSGEREFYEDVLNKLKWGDLIYYYGDSPHNGKDIFTHPPISARMYPFTFEEIHSDYVKGEERLVTAKPGVYGWLGDDHLHFSHRYDALGWEIPAGYLTTVDADGVRTEVALAEKQAAIVEKVPVRLKASEPVNVVFRQYDAKRLTLGLNGKGAVTLTVAGGEFEIKPGEDYLVKADKETRVKADSDGRLSFACELNGPLELVITTAGR